MRNPNFSQLGANDLSKAVCCLEALELMPTPKLSNLQCTEAVRPVWVLESLYPSTLLIDHDYNIITQSPVLSGIVVSVEKDSHVSQNRMTP